ncbi:MAG: hypothetical protein FJX47_05235 [Alphaproteobacteria bacterium]|nr:hypothetical protein [Alphaproteobacteria bacterium]
MTLAVSPWYVAINAILMLVLAMNVVRFRVRDKVGIGAGESRDLERAIRVHGNATEYVPIALVLMVVLELLGGGAMLLHGLGVALTVGRLAHAYGLQRTHKTSPGRFIGTNLTWIVILAGGVAILVDMAGR